ncbi:hypothetical protein BH10PLA1_BH10PLA1_14260 [soil metagenome]
MNRDSIKRTVRNSLVLLALAAGASVSLSEPTTKPADSAAETGGAEMIGPAIAAKPTISPAAQTELDAITAAYGKLTALDLAGTLNVQTDVDGQARKDSAAFTSSYQSPLKFRHATQNDLVVGNTGEKTFIFAPEKKVYLQVDSAKTKADFAKTPTPASRALEQQNPSLYLALADDAGKALIHDATDVTKIADEKIGDKNYSALAVKTAENDLVVLLDPQTHILRQLRIDLSKELKAQGNPNVKLALATFDYTTVVPDAPAKPDQFAWTPPEGAKDAAAQQHEMGDDASAALLNKPAPDFTLVGMDDQKVSLKDLKGSVVILDFWATWCGPCRMSLPLLDKLYQDKHGAGLKAFAVDLNEEKQTVQDFVTKTKLTIPVLLSTDEKMSTAYGVSGIPQTVLIGKDGIVKKVVVGFDPAEVDAMRKLVDAELKAK